MKPRPNADKQMPPWPHAKVNVASYMDPLHLGGIDRGRALTRLSMAIDYAVTAIRDLDRSHGGAAREDIVEVLIQLRDLRELLSPYPAMERPIGDEFLQEWMR